MGNLIKIGVFYDGEYFSHVNNYYNFVHPRKKWIYVSGLHNFIKAQVAEKEHAPEKDCEIVQAHFFSGRFNARDARMTESKLYSDRVIDDILIHNSIKAHYLPLKGPRDAKHEKGVDVMLALEAYEICMNQKLDVAVLVVGDGDFVTLPNKLHGLGCKTMLFGWNIQYKEATSDYIRTIMTSSDLREKVTYSMEMDSVIDSGLESGDVSVLGMFIAGNESSYKESPEPEEIPKPLPNGRHRGQLMSKVGGGGFIKFPNNNVYFDRRDLSRDVRFDKLQPGDMLEFNLINDEVQQRGENITLVEQ